MMNKRIILAVLTALALLCGCKKDPVPQKEALDITGVWELNSVKTKATVGSVSVSVYLSFTQSGTFELYQKIGDGRYTRFAGTYVLSEEDSLSGQYDGGKAWGPYDAAVSGTTLTLSVADGTEVDSYRKIDNIPDSVTENVY